MYAGRIYFIVMAMCSQRWNLIRIASCVMEDCKADVVAFTDKHTDAACETSSFSCESKPELFASTIPRAE